MALVIGNGTYSNQNPNGTSQTLSHNHGGGTNGLLLVHIAMQNTVTVTGMTYNGVAMTLVRADKSSGLSKNATTYYLLNPATGSNNIVISFSGSQFNVTGIFARSFSGASGIGNNGFNDAASSPHSQNITVSTNSIVFLTGMSSNAQSFGYDFDGVTATNVGDGFNINSIVEAAYSQSLTSGSKAVVTKTDTGSITNHRVEVLESGGGGGDNSDGDFFFFF